MQLHMQADGMRYKKIVIALIIVLLGVSAFSSINYSVTCKADSVLPKFYVDLSYNSSTPGWNETHFSSIQKAIDNASTGDRIIVYNGEYKERILINKSISLFGEDAEETIINGEGNGDVVTINISNVDLSTFTIKESSSGETDAGVKINADNCRIIENIISDCRNGIFINNYDETIIAYNTLKENTYGIFLSLSSDNEIEYNDIYSNFYDGIFLNETCNDNQIIGNEIYSNTYGNGIYLSNKCDDNYISDNTIYSNGIIGIRIENSSNNQIVNENTIELHNSYYGIMIVGNNNSIQENIIENNKYGIFLLADNYTMIYKNTITENNLDGIRMQNSTGDTIYTNTITDNSRHGVYVNYFSINNEIYDNYFEDNEYNAWDISTSSDNHWNKSITGKNIIGGSKIAGNFWDDYTGADANSDGIGDTAYNILPRTKKDNKPLVSRNPTADPGGTYTAYIGETITFDGSNSSDPDGNTLTYNWDFGDDSTGTGEKPKHKYASAGEYEVILTVNNSYGKTDADNTTATILTDTQPPTITIVEYGASEEYPNSFTFKVEVIDNTQVSKVYIEYWYEGSEKMTADMENNVESYYQKMITPSVSTDKVYCVIYANDTSGNQADTKKPYANAGGLYYSIIGQDIDFDGSESFDLDGNITEYLWDFGDGLTGTGKNISHPYSTNGVYTVSLTVTDEDSNTNTDTTTATVITAAKVETSTSILNEINSTYKKALSDLFYAYDTDGDDIVDRFVDPNKILSAVHTGGIDINDNIVFLISTGNDDIPEFFWDSTTNTITEIEHKIGSTELLDTDENNNYVSLKATTSKTDGWIYLEVVEPDISQGSISGLVSVTKNGQEIDSDKIFRKNDKVYILDDPEIEYIIAFSFDPIVLENAIFNPEEGSIIDENSTTIEISYNIPVTIIEAYFYEIDGPILKAQKADGGLIDITYILESDDSTTFYYTPPNDLPSGFYEISISAKQTGSTEFVTDYAWYEFASYALQEKSLFTLNMLLYLGPIILLIVAIFILSRKLNITFESFIYFRDKKIIPFIKPIVFGPLSIDVNDEKISKAEFYLNGELKDTLTEAPFTWKFDEPSFMHHKIETKVYDEQGKESSSGEMTFFVFNPRFFK